MPKPHTAKQIAASRRNLVKARQAKKLKLYHHTNATNASKLLKSGFSTSVPERPVFLTTRKIWSTKRHLSEANAAVVTVEVSSTLVKKDWMQPRGETWYVAKSKDLKGSKIALVSSSGKRVK